MRSAPRVGLVLAVLNLPVTISAAAAYTEAPELHRQVEMGTLPAVENRLPFAPLVVSPVEKPGEYGGTWHMVLVGYDNGSMFFRSLAYEHLVRWDPNRKRIVPNVASSWTVNVDATVYRFQLRRGMRWSNEQPYTPQDIVAWVDDVVREPDLTPVPPAGLVEPNREIRAALMAEVLDLAADEFYAMGICLEPSRIAIRTPGFRNVPASHFDSWLYPDPGPFNPCQFFHEKPVAAK